MAEEGGYQMESAMSASGAGMKDLEERQRIIRERLLLVGKNLLETKEELGEIKRNIETLNNEIRKIKELLQNITYELEEFARKDELEVIARQLDMLSPLEFARIEDVKKMIKKGKVKN